MFVVRAVFWIGLVALLMPHGANYGPERAGDLARAFQENVLTALSRVKSEFDTQKPVKPGRYIFTELSLQAESPLPSGLAQPRAPWSPSPLSPPRRL